MELMNRDKVNLRQYSMVVTGTSSFVNVRSVGIPYQTLDGAWRLAFNISGTVSSTDTMTVTIAGITTVAAAQCCSSSHANASYPARCYIAASGNTITGSTNAASTTWAWAGDIELASKPTWME